MIRYIIVFIAVLFVMNGCGYSSDNSSPFKDQLKQEKVELSTASSTDLDAKSLSASADKSITSNKQIKGKSMRIDESVMPDSQYEETDLVPLAEVVPGIEVDLIFAGTDHPFGKNYYKNNISFLRFGTAKKLAKVQARLKEQGLGLKIWDSYRPFVVQEAIFHEAGGNANWVSDPYKKSGKKTHVRGVALDCTIIDSEGNELEMPTPYLDFAGGAEKMKHTYNDLSDKVLANRTLLKTIMTECGMEIYTGEWWHYQDQEWSKYPLINTENFPEVHKKLLADRLQK